MAENDETKDGRERAGSDAAAYMALNAASRAKADAYLEKNARLVDLQIEDVERENAIRHWSLRVRHISDVMKLTFELAVAIILVAFVTLIGVTVWKAAHDNSLVIEVFSVPPDLAARGLTGQAVAAQVQDSLSAMQAATNSARPASSYANNWGDDIKVQIPDTGVSVGEFYRLLVSWMGNQTHISGEVWRNVDQVAITARVGADAGSTVTGKEANLPALLHQAAEKIYAHTQPYRYSAYLEEQIPAHNAEARKVLETLVSDGDRRERAWAWLGLSTLDNFSNDAQRSIDDLHKTLALAPNMPLAYIDLDGAESTLGHDEASLDAEKNALRLLQGRGEVDMSDRARALMLAVEQANIAFAQNDFKAALVSYRQAEELPDYAGNVENARQAQVAALALLHDGAAERQLVRDLPPTHADNEKLGRVIAEATADYWLGHWPAVLVPSPKIEQAYRTLGVQIGAANVFIESALSRQWWPYAATAMAMTGDFKGAHALIDRTPRDCYACVRNRANIDTIQKNWRGAAYWFAVAVQEAPSIPLGYAQRGGMLLAKGDLDGAIAKLETAHRMSPHFADPLELWGEALIAKNRADLALANFEEANKFAPNWGRLHLKWGEALGYAGRKNDAEKQLAIAAGLDLSASDKSELARMRGHG